MKTLYSILLLHFLSAYSLYGQCLLPKPEGVSTSQVTSCDVTLNWSPVTGASKYKVRYKESTTTTWIKIKTGNVTSFTITGLSPGTSYSFGVAAVCTDNSAGKFSPVLNDTTLPCQLPIGPEVTNATPVSGEISWQLVCGAQSYKLRYRKTVGSVEWIQVPEIHGTSFTITGLQPACEYKVQLGTNCINDTAKWTSSIFFTTDPTPQHPNILFIMLDDARYDAFKVNGGPSFFKTPSMDRIANEGANFEYMIPASALCTPSRASVYSGLYPHKHKCLVNGDQILDSLPLIQEILQDHGYYTGLIGRYGQNGNPPGFDWYLNSISLEYVDPTANLNGDGVTLPGHVADSYADMATQFLDGVPDQTPFLLFFHTLIPHGPTIPRTQDETLYKNKSMPFPDNFFEYNQNFPSYTYCQECKWSFDSTQTDSMRRIEFQCMMGAEYNVDTLLSYLEHKGILDYTMVIFTSDNGYMKGEHLLGGKKVAYEESIRLPLFVRYPPWFAPNTVIDDAIASNIDMASTFLDAAGIIDTFGFDGISLRRIATTDKRKDFFYEFYGEGNIPGIRAVRSLKYKYIRSLCHDTTEQFFDLTIDPRENVNLIFNPSYLSLIQEYRNKLDSLQVVYEDVLPPLRNCSLQNVIEREIVGDEPNPANECIVFPNPADESFTIDFSPGNSYPSFISVKDELGRELSESFLMEGNRGEFHVGCRRWAEGIYIVSWMQDEGIRSEKVMVVH